MMSITHQKARRLIQFNADNALNGNEKSLLQAHLESCVECRSYSSSIQELEFSLGPMLHKRWDSNPLPSPLEVLHERKDSKLTQKLVMATRITAMSIICIAFLFNIWQFSRSSGSVPSQPSANVYPAPTPSLQFTSTSASDQKCDQILYTIQKTDTLESIAHQFSITREDLLAANNISMQNLTSGMKLRIPTCGKTPIGTTKTVTTTFTPLLGSTPSTPVNGPTQ